MIIKIISDLHLNSNTRDNDFSTNDLKFVEYLRNTSKTANFIIINGDLFELWKTIGWKRKVAKIRSIIKDRILIFLEIFKLMVDGKLIYVVGNHDEIIKIKNIFPCERTVVREFKGVRILFEHGHMADIYNSKFSFIGRTITYILGLLEKIGLTNADVLLKRMANKIVPGNAINDEKLYNYAVSLSKKHDADIVVFGHTHRKMIRIDGEFHYANSGSCVERQNMIDEITIEIHGENNFYLYTNTIDL